MEVCRLECLRYQIERVNYREAGFRVSLTGEREMNKWRENPRRIRFHICRTRAGKQNVIKIGVSMFESGIASIVVDKR